VLARLGRTARLAALLVATWSPRAFAQTSHPRVRWLSISDSGSTSFAVDLATLIRRADRLRVWVRSHHDVPRKFLPGDPSSSTYTLFRLNVDCAARRYRVLEGAWYDATHARVGQTPSSPGRWVAAVPGSVGEAVITLCSRPRILDGSYYRALVAWADSSGALDQHRETGDEAIETESLPRGRSDE
jgi:hypothetical protein